MAAARTTPSRSIRGTVVIALAVFSLPIVWAQAPRDVTAPAQAVAPAVPSGNSQIAGRVVDHAGAPVRRAIVRLSGGGLVRSRSVVTNDQGQFVLDGLPAGQFTLVASKPAFVSSAYGSKGPGRPGTPMRLSAGERVGDVVIVLTRGAAIEGTVRDQSGEPVPNAQIAVMRAGPMTLVTGRGATPLESDVMTDDRGVYRVFGLEPGSYVVGAGIRFGGNGRIDQPTAPQIDAALSELQRRQTTPVSPAGRAAGAPAPAPPLPASAFAPMFYPGTTDVTQATPVAVQAGGERRGIDIVLAPLRAVAVEGVVTNGGGPLPSVQIGLTPANVVPLPPFFASQPVLAVPPGPDGRFRFEGVTPGTYTVTVRSMAAAARGTAGVAVAVGPATSQPGPGPVLWASADVTVTGQDIAGIALSLQPALRLAGRVTFSGKVPAPATSNTLRVTLTPPGGVSGTIVMNGAVFGRVPTTPAAVGTDGSFEFSGVLPGLYQIGVVPAVPGWWLRSAMVNGRDALDAPLEIPSTSGDLTGVELTFTDQHSELVGTLQTPAGAPATDYVVIVFTTDRALWRPQARRLVSTRPATDGQFSVRDLPAGEYYVAALTDLDPQAWQDAAFLETVVPAAVRVSLAVGEQKRQDLRIR